MAITRTWLRGFPRWTEEVTWSNGSWQTLYPVSNLGRLPFAKVARSVSADPAVTRFTGTLATPRPVEILRFDHHNVSITGQFRIYLYERQEDVAPVYDSGWQDFWPTVYTEDDPQASWDSGNWWDRTYTQQEREASPAAKNWYIPGQYSVERFTVLIRDEDNPEGFVEIGLCEVAAAQVMPRAASIGAVAGFTARTRVTEAEGGVKYFERRTKRRTFSGVIPMLERDYAQALFYELDRINDLDVPFIWWPDIEETRHELRSSFLARNAVLEPITRALLDRDSVAINIEEVL